MKKWNLNIKIYFFIQKFTGFLKDKFQSEFSNEEIKILVKSVLQNGQPHLENSHGIANKRYLEPGHVFFICAK